MKGDKKKMEAAIQRATKEKLADEKRMKMAAAQRKKRWQEMKAEIKKNIAEKKLTKEAEKLATKKVTKTPTAARQQNASKKPKAGNGGGTEKVATRKSARNKKK